MVNLAADENLNIRSLPSLVAQHLRKAIITGRFQPDERLLEKKLGNSLGVSQPTVREALSELEDQGFVRKIPKKGSYVTALSKEDFGKILEVRMEMEGFAFELAARAVTPQLEAALGEVVAEMEAAARENNRWLFHKADLRFHRLIWEASGNQYLGTSLERICFALFAFVLIEQEPEAFLAAVDQHQKLVEGLLSGDPQRARKEFVENTRSFWARTHGI